MGSPAVRWVTGLVTLAGLAVMAGCTAAAPGPAVTARAASSAAALPALAISAPSALPTSSLSISSLSISAPSISAAPNPEASTGAQSSISRSGRTSGSTSMTTSSVPTSDVDPRSTSAPGSTPPASTALPDVGVSGVNDPSCRSGSPPVVLLHGTFATTRLSFSALVPELRGAGRCVFALDYGRGGIGAVTDSAAAAADLVRTVLSITGRSQVDLVGYSQGGLVIRTALRLDGLADRVRVAVLIAPSFHGTTSPLTGFVPASLCQACADQAAGSALLNRLDAGGDLDGDVHYAVVSTRSDDVVTPVSSQVPSGPPDRVRSVIVQDICPSLAATHQNLPAVPGVINWVLDALATDGRPDPSTLTCA